MINMSKFQVNTKSSNYNRDKELFLKDLKHFNDGKSVPYKIPNVNGLDIDLYLFYTLVQQRGGLSKVNQADLWDSFLRPLRLPHPCINGSTLLRKIYSTYLEKYERAKGPPGRDDDNDMEDDYRRGRGTGGNMPRVTFSGAYISEPTRTGPRYGGTSERLALSLLSPMPNEQDFAVNVCTVLAANLSNRMPLSTTPHILDFLLAHAGVYSHSNLRDTIGRSYYETRGMYPDEFWKLKAGGGGVRELADETKFMSPGLEQPELMVQALAAQNTLTDSLNLQGGVESEIYKVLDEDFPEEWVTDPSEEDQLFAPQLPGGAKCVYTQRIQQITSIVRSLSFFEENIQHLVKNTTVIRFLLLCANCWVGNLRQSGLDTLGNISTELIIKEPATCLISRHILSTIQAALCCNDRSRILAALELLNKLAHNEHNEDILLRALESKVYNDVCALLTHRDIMLLVCTLECVYALTSLGERACECVARVSGLVHTLVSLVTVEAQSYGPRACILMRVVETVSGPSPPHDEKPAIIAQPTPVQQMMPQVQAPLTPSKPELKPQPAPPSSPTVSHSPAPVSSLQQQHQQQQQLQENEQFALAWLRASFEPLPVNNNSGVEVGEVYRQYMVLCTKLNRKGVIAPAHFPRLLRTVFGCSVGPNTVTIATGETQQIYVGIRSRNPQNRNTQPNGPASPILKAQLTNKPGAAETKTTPPPAQQPQPVPNHPHLSQALETNAGSSTTLIKHLLAHKVSPAPHAAMQVAQRQQNQQRVVGQAANTVIVQQPNNSAMEVDPEALIKCTTITPGGIASSMPIETDKMITGTVVTSNVEDGGMKEEPVHIQIDEQTQLTIKTAQNKMLADLLEKKSNPPVQVVQMSQSMNAPTIQITETGQIVQVKSDNPVLQINSDTMLPHGQYIQIKNEQGQLLHLKNEQGQLIQFSQPGAVKNEKEHLTEAVVVDHSYTEPPCKKLKKEEKREKSPQESVSKTAANLYAALAASALEDEEDLVQQPAMHVQQPTLQVQQPTMQVQQPTMQVQTPMLQVQPMDVQMQNIISTQGGQLILQEKQMPSQSQYVQQPMQIITTPNANQGGISYITQNIQGNMMQPHKTIIIVQGATGGGPITLTVNNPGGLDEATLNSLITQATEAITQQQIMQNSGVMQSAQRVIVSQPTLVSTSQPMTMVKTALSQNPPQLTASQQPMITTQPQPHKAQLMQQPQQIVVTQKPAQSSLISSTANPIVTVTGNQQMMSGNQQIMSGNQQIMSGTQQICNQQLLSGNQQIISGNQQICNQQLLSGNQQIISGNQQIMSGNQQIISGNQQYVSVSGNQQIIMNTPMKQTVRMVQGQRNPVQANQVNVQADNKSTVIQNTNVSTGKTPQKQQQPQPVMRQVITRQPVMVGSTKIGDKEVVVRQPVIEGPTAAPKPKQTPPVPMPATTPPQQPTQQPPPQDESPWTCHWRGCGKTFENAAAVFSHAARTHVPTAATGEASCQWADCDRVPRRTFALLNHLHDKHCTVDALKALYAARRSLSADADDGKQVSLGYPPNAAMAALNKHAVDFLNPRELMDENEGPVTKSIRLTAALILRNIVIYSNTGRRQLRYYEPHLASIAISSVEASRTISQVLYDMNSI